MSANPDRYCPFPNGRGEPDAASIVAAIEASTGVTCERTFGKPSRLMAEIVLSSIGVTAANSIMVGDRLGTDVAMGRRAGMQAALVLTGDSSRADVDAVSKADRPTHIVETLADLLPAAEID